MCVLPRCHCDAAAVTKERLPYVSNQQLTYSAHKPASGNAMQQAVRRLLLSDHRGRRGVVVTRVIQSAKLLSPGPVNTAMGDCLWAGKPSRDVTNRLGQLSLPSLRGRLIEYRPIWLGLRRGTFTSVGWQVTLCDPI